MASCTFLCDIVLFGSLSVHGIACLRFKVGWGFRPSMHEHLAAELKWMEPHHQLDCRGEYAG